MNEIKKWIGLFVDRYREYMKNQGYESGFSKKLKIYIVQAKSKFAFGYITNDKNFDLYTFDDNIYQLPSDAIKSLTSKGISNIFLFDKTELSEDPLFLVTRFCNSEIYHTEIKEQTDSSVVNSTNNLFNVIESKDNNLKIQKINNSFEINEIQIPKININKLPLLMMYVNESKELISLKDYHFIIIQHLLDDFPPFLMAIEVLGVLKSNIHVIGIPYSSKQHVIDLLKIHKYNVRSPQQYLFEKEIEEEMKLINSKMGSNQKILVIEDGGYVLPLLFKLNMEKKCAGIIEQTQNGINRDKEFLSSKNIRISFPIINVAESEIKKNIEPIFVTDAMVRNIKFLLIKTGRGIHMKKILIIGYGSIGIELANKLKNENVHFIMVYDTNIIKLAEAHARGFVTSENLIDLVKQADIIIGTTGNPQFPSVNKNVFLNVKDQTILVSVSSKNKEIDIDALEKLSIEEKKHIKEVGSEYHIQKNKKVLLLADGFPVNFYDTESVPKEQIQFVITMLFCSIDLALNKFSERNEIISFPNDLSVEIIKLWRELTVI